MKFKLVKFKLTVGTIGFALSIAGGLMLAGSSFAQAATPSTPPAEESSPTQAEAVPVEEPVTLEEAVYTEPEEAVYTESDMTSDSTLNMGTMDMGTMGDNVPSTSGMDDESGTDNESSMNDDEEMSLGESVTVTVNLTDAEGIGDAVGTVTLENNRYGLLLTPALTGLMPGIHGFHFHQNAACGPAEKDGQATPGLAAGGHYDPESTGAHEGPYGEGHLGDLPPLYVDAEGNAMNPVLAPRLTVEDVQGRSLMIHMNGDNFSDTPEALGGGGARFACGVVE